MRIPILTVGIYLLECFLLHAEVAELADALRSGRSSLTGVWVRLPPSAHETRFFSPGFFILPIVCPQRTYYASKSKRTNYSSTSVP
jgi:hypothetical protein